MANQTLINNLKFITDKALSDMTNGIEDANIDQTMGNYVNSGAIATGGQSYDVTVSQAVAYYKYIKGEVSLGGNLSTSDPLLYNMKVLSDKAIADRKNAYVDPNIEDTLRQMVRSGQILTGGQTEEKTVADALWYYKYIKGPDSILGYGGVGTTTGTGTGNQTSTGGNNTSTGGNTSNGSSGNGSSSSGSSGSTGSTTTGSGTSTSNNNDILKIQDGDINGLITETNKCVSDIINVISKIKNVEIPTINNSWAATESKSYVDKVSQSITKMENICKALDLLAQTYTKALQMNEQTGNQVSNYVNNI